MRTRRGPMKVPRNDRRVIEAAAEAAGVPTTGFAVEEQAGVVIINHRDSTTWSKDVWTAITTAVKARTNKDATVT